MEKFPIKKRSLFQRIIRIPIMWKKQCVSLNWNCNNFKDNLMFMWDSAKIVLKK